MFERKRLLARGLLIGGFGLGLLAGCGSLGENMRVPGQDEYNTGSRRDQVRGRLGGGDGILVLGTDRSSQSRRQGNDVAGTGLGVNAYLWRATLDTLSFMPLSSADPFGGEYQSVITTPPQGSAEESGMKDSVSSVARQR